MDRNKINHREETEINSGDSSNIQKSRHSSSSSSSSSSSNAISETRRIQLNPAGDKPEVLTTTYTHNSSGTSLVGSGDLIDNRGVVFHSESGGSYGSTTLGGGFRGTEEESFGSRLPNPEEPYATRVNHSVRIENRWDSGVQDGRTVSSSGRYDSILTESERQYQLRQQEKARQRKLEEEAQRQREEQQRIFNLQRLREEEERRRQEEWRRTEEERRREEEKRKVEEEEERRRVEEEERRRQNERRLQEEREYDEERRYDVSAGSRTTKNGFITGDREETVGGIGFRVHNVTSTQELERFFGTLSKDATDYQIYNRQGHQYVQFKARFRTSADRKEYIEFQDGSMFPLQDHYGRQSYVSESTEPRDSRFLRIEGRLLIAPDSKGYIVLKDGRRFPLQGSFTYTEERTYTLRVPQDGYQDGNANSQRTYGHSWQEESSSRGVTSDGSYENRYNTRTHEERRTEERTSRIYGKDRLDDDYLTEGPDPNLLSSRYRRESDMVDIKEFKKAFQQNHRHRRDLETESDLPNEATFQTDDYYENDLESEEPVERRDLETNSDQLMTETQNDDYYENDRELQEPVGPCNAAKCVTLRCVLGPLKKDQEVWIGARYRINARTLKEVAFNEKIKVSTKLVARVTKQPFIGTPAEKVTKDSEVFTNVEPSAPPSAPDIIPLWVVVLSACAGMIILLLLIYLLHKVSLKRFVHFLFRQYFSNLLSRHFCLCSAVSSRGTGLLTLRRDNR